jgi:hypothetical protein
VEAELRVMHINGSLQITYSTGRQVDVKCVGKQAAREISNMNISYKKQESIALQTLDDLIHFCL